MSDNIRCKIAIVGGSTGFRFLKDKNLTRLGTVATPFGTSAAIYMGTKDDVQFLYMSRHGENGYEISAPFVNYRANIWALKEMGVERIIAWSGPAAIDHSIPIGVVLVPGDIIDETRGRPSTFFANTGLGFVRQNPVFCPELSDILAIETIRLTGACRREDVYVCTEGPRLETPAEIRKALILGGTLVGMTLAPEVFLAKELEMCYAPICYVTNYAEGVRKREFAPGVLFGGLLDENEAAEVDKAAQAVGEIALSAVTSIAEKPRGCLCGRIMERYKKRGDIDTDWHNWIRTEQRD
jgi:5'-methylthioadenosine phosphorylase